MICDAMTKVLKEFSPLYSKAESRYQILNREMGGTRVWKQDCEPVRPTPRMRKEDDGWEFPTEFRG